MSDIGPQPSPSEKKSSGNKTILVVVVIVIALAIVGFIVRSLTQKASTLISEKAAEKIIENATGGNADVDFDSDNVTIKTKEGTFSTGTSLPADWPKDAPVYPDSTVTYSGSSTPQNGNSGFSIITTTGDSVQKVGDYYSKELVTQGWTVESTQNISGTTIIGAVKDKRSFTMSASASDGVTSITLVVASDN